MAQRIQGDSEWVKKGCSEMRFGIRQSAVVLNLRGGEPLSPHRFRATTDFERKVANRFGTRIWHGWPSDPPGRTGRQRIKRILQRMKAHQRIRPSRIRHPSICGSPESAGKTVVSPPIQGDRRLRTESGERIWDTDMARMAQRSAWADRATTNQTHSPTDEGAPTDTAF